MAHLCISKTSKSQSDYSNNGMISDKIIVSFGPKHDVVWISQWGN